MLYVVMLLPVLLWPGRRTCFGFVGVVGVVGGIVAGVVFFVVCCVVGFVCDVGDFVVAFAGRCVGGFVVLLVLFFVVVGVVVSGCVVARKAYWGRYFFVGFAVGAFLLSVLLSV